MEYIIDKECGEITLRDFLKQNLNVSSRMLIHLKKKKGALKINGEDVCVNAVVHVNDKIYVDFSDENEDENDFLFPSDIPIDIIYEDENITVVNKPPKMPTHQSYLHHEDTLANALKHRYKDKAYVFRAVNRLDKDTSGVVVTSNNKYYSGILAKKLQNGEFEKEYIAIVKGKITESGIIEAPIKRCCEGIIKREVSPDGENAVTEYYPIFWCDEITVLRVKPRTGRTHQIRVHMQYIGHPIIGDALYFEESRYINRQALHARRIKINGIGDFFAEIPSDMKSVIERYFGNEGIIP